MATIINLTPHTVNICNDEGAVVRSFPSKGIARATQISEPAGSLDGIELTRMTFGETYDLPSPAPDTYYVVSVITASAAKDQGRSTDDLLITADPVRDDNGKILGCKSFALV